MELSNSEEGSQTISLRFARDIDVYRINKLLRELVRFSKRKRLVEIRKAIDLKEIVVATTGKVRGRDRGEKIVGFIHGITHRDPISAGPLLFLTAFYVKAGFRRRGIGSRLLDFIIEQSIRRSAIVGVEVSTARKNALRFYMAHGFEQFKEDFKEVLLLLEVGTWNRRSEPAKANCKV